MMSMLRSSRAGALGALFVGSGLLVSSSAMAADLGGNCCADLEERVAELEATTARKGNRKVSLTVSGWINEAVFLWDDGVEQNVYVGTNSLEQSRVRFLGDAKIDPNWSAGYILELGIVGTPSSSFDQTGPGTGPGISVRKSNWFIKNKTYGKLTVGLEGTATYHVLDDADAVNTRNYADEEGDSVAMGRFRVRSNGAFVNNLRWSDFLQGVNNDTPGQNGRRNIVRYDSPELMGFTLTASWGEDDMAGASLTYKFENDDFKIVAKGGYEHDSDENSSFCSNLTAQDCYWFGLGGTVLHKPTGLFVYGGYGQQTDDREKRENAAAEETDRVLFIQSGIEKKWFPLGLTTVFGEYRKDDAGTNLGSSFNGSAIRSSDITFWSGGIVQNIDAASMSLYAIYHHADGDSVNFAGNRVQFDEFDMLMTGARIQF